MDKQQRRRWRVKDTVFSLWQDLPGLYTVAEIAGMQRQGCFAAATPSDGADYQIQDGDARSPQLSKS